MLTHNIGQGGRRLRDYLQRISITNQGEHLLAISLGSGHPKSRLRRGHCQLLLLRVCRRLSSVCHRRCYYDPLTSRYPNLAIKAATALQEPAAALGRVNQSELAGKDREFRH